MTTELQDNTNIADDDDEFTTVESNGRLEEFHTISHRVCQVLMPVTLCSVYVTLLVELSENNVTKSDSLVSRAWDRLGFVTSPEDEHAVGKAVLGSLYLVLIFLTMIVAITLIMLFVLYMEWHSCLSYYFYIPSLLIMALISPAYLRVIGKSLNWFALDLITLVVLTWNFTALGMMAIFGLLAQTPLIVQQLYLIHNSSMVAVLVLNFLPGWAPWMLLGFLVVWDLFAVMTPFGPLNLIVNMAEKSGIVDMPGLVYSTDIHPSDSEETSRHKKSSRLDATELGKLNQSNTRTDEHEPPINMSNNRAVHRDGISVIDSDTRASTEGLNEAQHLPAGAGSRKAERTLERKSIEERGINIGLGDFIFYGLLVGVTAKGQSVGKYYITLATFVSILVGLIATLAILASTRRTLPALPISIALGLFIAGLSMQFIPGFASHLATEQIFI